MEPGFNMKAVQGHNRFERIRRHTDVTDRGAAAPTPQANDKVSGQTGTNKSDQQTSIRLTAVGPWGQQLQRPPDFPIPSKISDFHLGDPETVQGQRFDVIPPSGPSWSVSGSPPTSGTSCTEDLSRETLERHPNQMPEPAPMQAPFQAKKTCNGPLSKAISGVSWCLGRMWFHLWTRKTLVLLGLSILVYLLVHDGEPWWGSGDQGIPQLWERVEAGGRKARQLWEEVSSTGGHGRQEYKANEASFLAGLERVITSVLERVLIGILQKEQEAFSGQLTQVRQELNVLYQQMSAKMEEGSTVPHHDATGGGGGMTAGMMTEVNRIAHNVVRNALREYSRDRTGMADYALQSAGGSIVLARCSETYTNNAAIASWHGIVFKNIPTPLAVIQPDVLPGNCWPFKGSQGSVAIKLSMRIIPTSFSLEHVAKALTLNGRIDSAPRDFQVYGLERGDSQENGTLLGSYTYREDGDDLQTFPVSKENQGKAFQIVEVRVQSNWGKEEFTCLYRFRVHGTPVDG